jgi:hypothetical protein
MEYKVGYAKLFTVSLMQDLPEFFSGSALLVACLDSGSGFGQKISDEFYAENEIEFDITCGYEIILESSVPKFLKAWAEAQIGPDNYFVRDLFDAFFLLEPGKIPDRIADYNHNEHFYFELDGEEEYFWKCFNEFGAKAYIEDKFCSSLHYVCSPENEALIKALEEKYDAEDKADTNAEAEG